jgi:hypothetical protein
VKQFKLTAKAQRAQSKPTSEKSKKPLRTLRLCGGEEV